MPGCVFESRWLLSANGPLTLVAYFSAPALASAALRAARRSGVSSLPLGALKHDLQDRAVARAELALEDVGGLLRVGARDHELVLERALERPEREHADDDEDEQAPEDGRLRMGRLAARDLGEQAFMGARLPFGRCDVCHPRLPFLRCSRCQRERFPHVRDARAARTNAPRAHLPPAHVNAVHGSNGT